MKQPLAYDLYMFDMGNVVVRDITTIDAIADHYGFDRVELHADYDHYAFPLMDGTIDSKLYWDHVEHVFGIQVGGDPLADFFRPRWNEPVVALIEFLHAKCKRVVCASNTYAPHWSLLRDRGFLDIFDATYASHEMGVSKPSPYFFKTILAREGIGAERTLFVDDYQENVVAARALGLDALLYSFDDSLNDFFLHLE